MSEQLIIRGSTQYAPSVSTLTSQKQKNQWPAMFWLTLALFLATQGPN